MGDTRFVPPIAEQWTDRLKRLVAKGEQVLASWQPPGHGAAGAGAVDREKFGEWRAQSLAALTQLLGAQHIYASEFSKDVDSIYGKSSTKAGIGILKAALEDVENGHLASVETLVSASVFSDLLDMARHLSDEGYKDAAASLAGAVLEDGLRRVMTLRGLVVKKGDGIDSMNAALAKHGVYSALVRSKVDTWRQIRNAADHGHFDQYTQGDVSAMVAGVGDLLGSLLT